MQDGYEYERTEPAGRNFDPEFKPELTPKEMLTLGGVPTLPPGMRLFLTFPADR